MIKKWLKMQPLDLGTDIVDSNIPKTLYFSQKITK